MRLKTMLIAACSLLVGCAEYVAGRSAFDAEARIIAAEALERTLWAQCRASPVGAIIDRYGKNDEDWMAYGRLCRGHWQADSPPLPLKPPGP